MSQAACTMAGSWRAVVLVRKMRAVIGCLLRGWFWSKGCACQPPGSADGIATAFPVQEVAQKLPHGSARPLTWQAGMPMRVSASITAWQVVVGSKALACHALARGRI